MCDWRVETAGANPDLDVALAYEGEPQMGGAHDARLLRRRPIRCSLWAKLTCTTACSRLLEHAVQSVMSGERDLLRSVLSCSSLLSNLR